MLLLCVLAFLIAQVSAAGRPVAHWDMVPYQKFSSSFNLGLIAFHINGLKVVMQVNNGSPITITDPTYNPESNVWEFWTTINPANYADGLLNVTATCYPNDPVSPTYTVPPFFVYANSKGSLTITSTIWADAIHGNDANDGTSTSPVQSLQAAFKKVTPGGTIYLQPGTYSNQALCPWPMNCAGSAWTTISAAPGVLREYVLVPPGRPSQTFLHYVGITFYANLTTGYIPIIYGNEYIWLDNIKCTNLQTYSHADVDCISNTGLNGFVTGGVSQGISNGPAAYYIKDHLLDTIYSDSWSGGNKMVVNCDTQYVNPHDTGAHPDFQQTIGMPMTYDVILYNVRGLSLESQGFFGVNLTDAAFVNCFIEALPGLAYTGQLSGVHNNVMYLHNTVINQGELLRGADLNLTDFYWVNNVIEYMSYYMAPDQAGLNSHNNMFVGGGGLGDAQIISDLSSFVNPSAHDYRLATSSPGYNAGSFLQAVPADITGQPHGAGPRNVGAYGASAAPFVVGVRNESTNPAAFGPPTSVCPSAHIGTGTGLRGEYYSDQNFTQLGLVRWDPNVNYNYGILAPPGTYNFPVDGFSIRWTGQLVAKYSGLHTFYLSSDDGSRLYINGALVVNNWKDQAVTTVTGTYTLAAGTVYEFKVEYYELTSSATVKLEWSSNCLGREVVPTSQFIPPLKLLVDLAC